ncbi:Rhodanese-like domain-containing protein 10 [Raphanus sativus]|nr:Rhodanese-like domain-containing protein 10 [Raphanus sativus]
MTTLLLPQPNRIHKPPLVPNQRLRKPYRLPVISAVSGQQLVTSGEVRTVEPREAKTLVSSEGYVLLDVRPAWEREKAHVKGSLHVPLFVEDPDNGPITLLKKGFPGQEVLVACGEGLRSLMAISKLHREGYKSLGWLTGGFNRANEGDFLEVEGPEELKFATIGGASYYFLKLLVLLQSFGKENR